MKKEWRIGFRIFGLTTEATRAPRATCEWANSWRYLWEGTTAEGAQAQGVGVRFNGLRFWAGTVVRDAH